MTRIRYIDDDSCPPHVRWVYCQGCDDYSERAGVVCHGEHTGLPACATEKDCERCRPVPDVRTAQLSDAELAILRGMPEWATKGIRGLR